MTTVPITVTIPVGPRASHRRWLRECLESINRQSVFPAEVLIIDDGAHLTDIRNVRIWSTPWLSGVAHSFNYGVALATNELVVMLGSDDRLLNPALEQAYATWQSIHDPLGYYGFLIEYDDGHIQDIPCNGAMVTQSLWKHTGGFPVEAAIGACDTWLLSWLYLAKGKMGTIYRIGEAPLYWYRKHAETDTRLRAGGYEQMLAVREVWLQKKLKELE